MVELDGIVGSVVCMLNKATIWFWPTVLLTVKAGFGIKMAKFHLFLGLHISARHSMDATLIKYITEFS